MLIVLQTHSLIPKVSLEIVFQQVIVSLTLWSIETTRWEGANLVSAVKPASICEWSVTVGQSHQIWTVRSSYILLNIIR